jgi:WD40 repeat protein
MEAEPRNSETFENKISYEVVATLEGHHDGVRDAVFLNYNNELKQVVSASEDSTLKVW